MTSTTKRDTKKDGGKAVVTTAAPATHPPESLEEVGEIAGQAVSGIRGVLAELAGFKSDVEAITRRGLFRFGGAALIGGAATATALVPTTAKAAPPAVSWGRWDIAVIAADCAYWRANKALNDVSRCRECDYPVEQAQEKYDRCQRVADALKKKEQTLTRRILGRDADTPGGRKEQAMVRKVYAASTTTFGNRGYHHSRQLAAAFMRLTRRGELAL